MIAITIIGLIAVITVPNLVKRYHNRISVTRLQKAYSDIENMATNIASATGCNGKDLSCTGLLDITDGATFFNEFVRLSGIKGRTVSHQYYRFYPLNYDKTNSFSSIYPYVSKMLIAKDNIGYAFSLTGNFWSSSNSENHKAIIVSVFTEPDFFTKTNLPTYGSAYPSSRSTVVGRNVFMFVIYDEFKVDACNSGWGGRAYAASKSATGDFCDPEYATVDWHTTGYGCTLKIIRDGWKINY